MKKTILVVDDYVSIRSFICETLQRKGYNTLGAANGTQAYQMLLEKSNEINLVLSDYNMPECNGFELLKMIRENPSMAKMPVIFLTTETDSEKINDAKEAGLSAWIRKPYRSEKFFAQIEESITHG
jgi:two-component system chemotaxis response regulator CheY